MPLKDRRIDLISRDGYDEPEYESIQMVVSGPVYGTNTQGEVGVWLNRTQEGELIAGILERRGTKEALEFLLNELAKIDKDIAQVAMNQFDAITDIPDNPIGAYCREQSKIHPCTDI